MNSNIRAGSAMQRATGAGTRDEGITPALLACGIVVGPFYLAVGLIQAFVRDGFDLARHPLSLLANGPGGWVQTANFIVSGVMVVAAALGFARVLGPKSRAVTWFLGAFGVSMLAAAVLRADPVDGFPLGTPLGMPTTISPMGMGHFIAGMIGFVSLAISCFVGARAMSRRGDTGMSRFSLLSGIAIVLGFFGGFIPGVSLGTAGIWFSVVVGWIWIAGLSWNLYRSR
jgi:hypothetical protein